METVASHNADLLAACQVLASPDASLVDVDRALDDVSTHGPLSCDDSLRASCRASLAGLRERALAAPRQEWPELADEVRAALEEFEQRVQARELLKRALDEIYEETEGGAQSLLAVESADPEGPFGAIARAFQLNNSGRLKEAVETLERTAADWPMCYEAALHLGTKYRHWAQKGAHVSSGEDRPAVGEASSEREYSLVRSISELDRAVALGPKEAYAYAARAASRTQLLPSRPPFDEEIVQSVEADLSKALQLDPQNAFAHTGRAELLRRIQKKEEALKWFDAALALPSLRPGGRFFALRNKAYTIGANPKGEPIFREALALRPSDARCLFNLSRICRETDRGEEALRFAEAACAAEPSNVFAQLQRALALAHHQVRRGSEAIPLLGQLLESLRAAPVHGPASDELVRLIGRREVIDACCIAQRFWDADRLSPKRRQLRGELDAELP